MKQITDEQIQQEAVLFANQFLDHEGLAEYSYTEGFKACLSQIEDSKGQDTDWISVEERLPTEQGHYFVRVLNSYPKNCDVIVCEFYEDNKTFYGESCDSPIHDALQWMKISE